MGKKQNKIRKIEIAKKPVNGDGGDGKRGHVGRNTWEGLHKPDISILHLDSGACKNAPI